MDEHYFGKIIQIKKETFKKTKWKGEKVGALNLLEKDIRRHFLYKKEKMSFFFLIIYLLKL